MARPRSLRIRFTLLFALLPLCATALFSEGSSLSISNKDLTSAVVIQRVVSLINHLVLEPNGQALLDGQFDLSTREASDFLLNDL
jgi:hypothetical protein